MVKMRERLEFQKKEGIISEDKYNQNLKKNQSLTEFTKIKDGKVMSRYDKGLEIKTSKKQDKIIDNYAKKHQNDKYYLVGSNCKDFASEALNKGGVENKTVVEEVPNNWYERLKSGQEKRNSVEWEYKAQDYERNPDIINEMMK